MHRLVSKKKINWIIKIIYWMNKALENTQMCTMRKYIQEKKKLLVSKKYKTVWGHQRATCTPYTGTNGFNRPNLTLELKM